MVYIVGAPAFHAYVRLVPSLPWGWCCCSHAFLGGTFLLFVGPGDIPSPRSSFCHARRAALTKCAEIKNQHPELVVGGFTLAVALPSALGESSRLAICARETGGNSAFGKVFLEAGGFWFCAPWWLYIAEASASGKLRWLFAEF